MKDLYLIFKNLTRSKLRLSLNLMAIVIAFTLFGVLGAVAAVFTSGVELSSDKRLVVVNKINFTQPLPLAYVNKIRAIEGVEAASWANWFGSYYQESSRMFPGFAVDPESYLEVYPELQVDDQARATWLATRQGVLIGERLANSFGWQVGDRVPISSSIFSQANGSNTWDFVVSGIFTNENPQVDTRYMLMHYPYFIETQTFGSDWVGWIPVATSQPELNETVAEKIDTNFANSAAETETSTEQQFNKAFIEQLGNIGFILTSVLSAAFFTILLVVGNSMALAIRERTKEIAVLKTLGFGARRVFAQVLSESLLLSIVGGLIGISVAAFMVSGISQAPELQSIMPNLAMDRGIFIQALFFMLALGLVTGILPAARAMNVHTVDALNRR